MATRKQKNESLVENVLEPASVSDPVLDPARTDEEARVEASLRPARLADFVGQRRVTENLSVYVEAARARRGALDHVLFFGPPGLGKHKGQLAALLTKLSERDVLFIDEIHRLSSVVEENLYTAMEDFRIDVVHGDGPMASTLQIPIAPFTLVGATTRTGLLTGPLLSRFGIECRLDYYEPQDLATIVKRSARILEVPIEEEASAELARRARGTPRIANRLLRRARDFAEVLGDGHLDTRTTRKALDRLEVDEAGLDEMNRRFLKVIIDFYQGGPVGIEALAATLSEPRDTLEDVIEPYLLQNGFLARTPKGRVATKRAYEHLGLKKPVGPQGSLF
jgi:Holliday junction DNA helicase RuvB